MAPARMTSPRTRSPTSASKNRRRKKLSRHLFSAILRGDTARVTALLRAGTDPERGNNEGTTPRYEASVNGRAEIARLLLAAGASP